MAITYPRVIPAGIHMVECDFGLRRFDVVNVLQGFPGSGANPTQGLEMASPRWSAKYLTRDLTKVERGIVRAWAASLKGVMHGFLAYDFDRPFPATYPNGFGGMTRHAGGSFNGTATVTALTASTISVSTLPSSFVLLAGDYIGLSQSGKRGLHWVLENVTASAGAATLTVEPPVLTNVFDTTALAVFEQPSCEMIMVPGSFSCPTEPLDSPASWQGMQKLI